TARRFAVAASAGLLIAGLVPIAASAASTRGRVVIRFSENEKTGAAPISGTYVTSGAISDRGAAAGTHFPVFGKHQSLVAIVLQQRQTGDSGSFVIKCRDSHFVVNPATNQFVRGSGPCVISSATGIYRRVAPVGSSTIRPTHPQPGHTHTERTVTFRMVG